MKVEHGFDLPRRLQIEFSKTIQAITEDSGTEISPSAMWDAFRAEYLPEHPVYELGSHELISLDGTEGTRILAQLVANGATRAVTGTGNGPIAAFVDALRNGLGAEIDVVDYAEHALGQGADATAVAYVETVDGDGTLRWGVGVHPNIITASLGRCSPPSDGVRARDLTARRDRMGFARPSGRHEVLGGGLAEPVHERLLQRDEGLGADEQVP